MKKSLKPPVGSGPASPVDMEEVIDDAGESHVSPAVCDLNPSPHVVAPPLLQPYFSGDWTASDTLEVRLFKLSHVASPVNPLLCTADQADLPAAGKGR